MSPGTKALSFYSEPIVLGGTRRVLTQVLYPNYSSVLRVDKVIAQTRFALNVRSATSSRPSSVKVSAKNEGVVGLPKEIRLVNLKSPPGWWRLGAASVLEAAKTETKRELTGLQIRAAHQAIQPSLDLGVANEESLGAPLETHPEEIVFPKIEVSDAHPVQGSQLKMTVSLEFQRDPTPSGEVSLPSDDRPHVFDVHLLFGRESHWSQLTFQRPQGTIEAAEFNDIQVHSLAPASGNCAQFPNGSHDEHCLENRSFSEFV